MKNFNKLNLTLLSSEVRFLLCLLKDKWDQESLEWLGRGIDWTLFIQLVHHHRVYPNVYHKLKELKSDYVPQFVLQKLLKDYQSNTYQMLYLSSEMQRLAARFEGREIKAIFLKGPVLAYDLYGDVSLRTSSDLDILVPIKKLGEIDSLLTQNGYIKDDYIHTILNDWKWRHHHFTYFHPDKNIKVEIHWRLNPGPAREPSFNELWERKRTWGLTSTPVFILGREDLFLFLLLHGARHGWSRLRWLLDVKHLIKQMPSWSNIQRLLKHFHCLHIAGQGVILVSQLLDVSLPKKCDLVTKNRKSERLAQGALFYLENMVNLHSVPVPDEISQYHSRHLFSLMPLRQKVLFILSFLFPYPEDAEILALPKKFHFLYFPLRPILWLWRKSKKVIPEEAKR